MAEYAETLKCSLHCSVYSVISAYSAFYQAFGELSFQKPHSVTLARPAANRPRGPSPDAINKSYRAQISAFANISASNSSALSAVLIPPTNLTCFSSLT